MVLFHYSYSAMMTTSAYHCRLVLCHSFDVCCGFLYLKHDLAIIVHIKVGVLQ
jgi:hypothetical protein